MIRINDKAPDFNVKAFHNNEIKNIKLSDYNGKWIVLFFYPADFTFVCPTELGDLADNYEKFKELNAEILSISTDTEFVHKAWYDNSETIGKIKFPMLADPTGKICKDYETYIKEEGLSLRGTIIIDPKGIIKAFEMHDNNIGRSTQEILRKIQAAKFVNENFGKVCPMNWNVGDKTLTPKISLVGKL